jgi:hypothetical protein
MRKIALFAVICIFGVVLLSGCSTVPKMPIKLDPNFKSKNIDTIVLMPVVDRRIDKKSKVDFEKVLRIPAKKILEKKGYAVVMPGSFSDNSAITADNVGEMNIGELSNLGPMNERALLFIYVDDVLDDYIVLAYTYKIEATGSLIEKRERIELWRDKGIGKSGQGGLISGPLSSLYQYEANSMCLNDMFCTLPASPVARQAQGRGMASAVSSEAARPMSTMPTAPSSTVSR